MIVVVGEALVDISLHESGVTATPGGAPFNVARGCARLGAPTALLAAVSTDALGDRLRAGLVDAGVEVTWIESTPLPTTLAVAEVDAAGVARYRFYVDGTSAPSLAPRRLPVNTNVLVAGGLGLSLEPIGTAVERMIAIAPPEVLVIVDVNARPAAIADRRAFRQRIERIAARADVIKVSDEDLDLLAPDVEAATAAKALVELGAGVVLATSGAGATTVVGPSGTIEVPVTPVEVVDTIGAGDAVTAGFAAWWRAHGCRRDQLADLELVERGVRAAHAVAAVVVTRRGADPPTRAELPADWGR